MCTAWYNSSGTVSSLNIPPCYVFDTDMVLGTNNFSFIRKGSTLLHDFSTFSILTLVSKHLLQQAKSKLSIPIKITDSF